MFLAGVWWFFVLLPLAEGIFLYCFYHLYYALVFWDVLGDGFADYYLGHALGADEDFSVDFDCLLHGDAFLAEGVTAFGYDSGGAVVEVVLLLAEWAVGGELFCWEVVHVVFNDYFQKEYITSNADRVLDQDLRVAIWWISFEKFRVNS